MADNVTAIRNAVAATQAQHAAEQAKANAPYGFLREPLSAATHAYSPAEDGGPAGRWIEPMERAQFGAWDADAPGDDDTLRALKIVHDTARKTWRDTVGTIEALRQDDDPSLNNDGRLKTVGRIVEPKLEAFERAAAAEIQRAEQAIADTDRQIATAVRAVDAIDVAVHADVRAHIRAQGGAQSVAAVYAAINAGDVVTLQAIATAPPYLSGLDGPHGRTVYDKAAAALAERMAPDLVTRKASLESGLATTRKAVAGVGRLIRRTIDLDRSRQLRERTKAHD